MRLPPCLLNIVFVRGCATFGGIKSPVLKNTTKHNITKQKLYGVII
jgi:hypothetical protein